MYALIAAAGIAMAGEYGLTAQAYAWPNSARHEIAPMGTLWGSWDFGRYGGITFEGSVGGNTFRTDAYRYSMVHFRPSLLLELRAKRQRTTFRLGFGPSGTFRTVAITTRSYRINVMDMGPGGRVRAALDLSIAEKAHLIWHMGSNLTPLGVELDAGLGIGFNP